MKLKDWVDKNKLNWSFLSSNENAIGLLEENLNKIDWAYLPYNRNAIMLLKDNLDNHLNDVDWCDIAMHKNIQILLKKYYKYIYMDGINYKHWNLIKNNLYILENNFDIISTFPNAIDYLLVNQHIINWQLLSGNENAINILEKNLDKIDWTHLSGNKKAIHILEKHIDKINWSVLSMNPNAINILERNQDKINWTHLSGNENAIYLLEKNQDKIDYSYLAQNSKAFNLLKHNIVNIILNWSNALQYLVFDNKKIAKKNLCNLSEKEYNSIRDHIDWDIIIVHKYLYPFIKIHLNDIDNYNRLSYNANAIDYLKHNQNLIDWKILSINPNIFTYNYKKLKETKQKLHNEIFVNNMKDIRFPIYNIDLLNLIYSYL